MKIEIIPLILNGIMLLALLIPAVRGWVNGFVKTTVRFLRFALSLLLAFLLAKPIGSLLHEKWLGNVFYNFVYGIVSDHATETTTASEMVESIPAGVRSILNTFNIDVNEFANKAATETQNIMESFSSSVSNALSSIVSTVLAFVGVFVISLILLIFLAKFLTAVVEKIPLVNKINKLLGLVVGALIGVFVAWVVSQPLAAFLTAFTEIDYSQAVLLNFFHEISPIRWILQFIMSTIAVVA